MEAVTAAFYVQGFGNRIQLYWQSIFTDARNLTPVSSESLCLHNNLQEDTHGQKDEDN